MNLEILTILWALTGLIAPKDHESSFHYIGRIRPTGLLTEAESADIAMNGRYFWNGKSWNCPDYANRVVGHATIG